MFFKYSAVVCRTVDSYGDSIMMMIEVDTVAGTAVIHVGVKVVADQQFVCVCICVMTTVVRSVCVMMIEIGVVRRSLPSSPILLSSLATQTTW